MMKARAFPAIVLVAGLLSSAGLSATLSGCTSDPVESAEAVPATAQIDPATEVAADVETGGVETEPAESLAGLRVSVPSSTTAISTVISTTATSAAATSTTASSTTTSATAISTTATSAADVTATNPTTVAPTPTPTPGSGVVGQRPDGEGNPSEVCLDGVIQPMADDATCGYADIGGYCLEQINYWRAQEGLAPFVRLEEFEACAAREARLALEAGRSHFSDGCGWRAQASSGGGRGGEGSNGTIEKSVWWLPKLIFDEGPAGGHYQGMMTERVRGVACGYFSRNREEHRIIINYYDL